MIFVLSGAAGSGGFPPLQTWHFPSQIFWTVVLFAFLYAALSRFVLPKIGSTIETRQSKIADDLAEADHFSKEADKMQTALNKRLATARTKAREKGDRIHADLQRQMADETARADHEMAEKLKTAQSRIDKMRDEAMKNIEQHATMTVKTVMNRFGITIDDIAAKQAITNLTARQDIHK